MGDITLLMEQTVPLEEQLIHIRLEGIVLQFSLEAAYEGS
jgi:hypothetical protein